MTRVPRHFLVWAVAAVAIGSIAAMRAVQADQRGTQPQRALEAGAGQGQVRYDGYSLVRVEVAHQRDLDRLVRMGGDIWTHGASSGLIEVLMPPQSKAALRATRLPQQVLVDDIQPLIEAERASLAVRAAWSFTAYQNYASISAQVDALVAQYPALASRLSLGLSLEGREIFALKIGSAGVNKTAVMFQGTQHAREWIAAMVPMYLADQLLSQAGTDPAIDALLSEVDVYIIPVVNPDGYEYSWATDRFWRKNRRPNFDGTFGVDPNRNWGGSWWGGTGSSSLTLNPDYRGTAPFSEPETQVVRDFVIAHPELRAMLDIHNYGQLVLSPWGHQTGQTPEPDRQVFDAQNAELDFLIESVHGANYLSGPAGPLQYVASGDAPDWHYGVQQLLAWTIELRPTTFSPGFLINPNQIIPTGEEIFPAALQTIRYATQSLDLRLNSAPSGEVAPSTPVVITFQAHPYPMFDAVDEAMSSVQWTNLATLQSGSVPWVLGTPWQYSAAIPGQPAGSIVEYHLVSAATVGGDVTTLPFDAPGVRFSFAVDQPADLNNDGFVDGSDLGMMLGNWGLPGLGDLNGDGFVDGADLGLLLGAWGI